MAVVSWPITRGEQKAWQIRNGWRQNLGRQVFLSALAIGNKTTVAQVNTDLWGTFPITFTVSLFSQWQRNIHLTLTRASCLSFRAIREMKWDFSNTKHLSHRSSKHYITNRLIWHTYHIHRKRKIWKENKLSSSWSKLSPEDITSSRLVAPGFPRMDICRRQNLDFFVFFSFVLGVSFV